ncbi:hypothetical protein PIB30_022453 [Stylosanthes scabra]|uniref:Isopenicillin N synthase-like Fe(2+) 2OG dioxygenase domain-containing protein n=1 Tax=Stylosanthes scabra TaxID=79078 RepID=A0ABU6R9H2_9FABA|nr:hypothetical protein [Stylosanthes scabra]
MKGHKRSGPSGGTRGSTTDGYLVLVLDRSGLAIITDRDKYCRYVALFVLRIHGLGILTPYIIRLFRYKFKLGKSANETLNNEYAKLVVELDHVTKRMVCDRYGLEQRHYHDLIESTTYTLRSFRYALPKKDESNNNVKLKNGEWFDIDPSPFMFLVLAGESFQVWSNDRIKAFEHRVMIKNEKKQRFSMGLFSVGTTIQPHEELVDDEHPRHYKPFDFDDYLKFIGTKEAFESNCRIKTFCGIDD